MKKILLTGLLAFLISDNCDAGNQIKDIFGLGHYKMPPGFILQKPMQAHGLKRTKLKKRQEAEAARKKKRQEAEAARKKKRQEAKAALKRQEAEAARKKKHQEAEAARKKKHHEAEAARKKRQEAEAARKKKRLEAEAARKKRQEARAALKKRQEAEVALKKRQEAEAALKKRQEAEAAANAKRIADAKKAQQQMQGQWLTWKEQELQNELHFDYKRPVSNLAAEVFAAKCLGTQATVIREMTECEHNIERGLYGAPQLFRAKAGGENYIVRTVDKTKEIGLYQPYLGGGFDDAKIKLLENTQKKLKSKNVVLAYPIQFADFDPTYGNKKVNLVNSPYKIGKYKVHMELMKEASGTQLSKLLETNKGNTKTSFDLGFLAGKGMANLHKLETTHGDALTGNIFVDQKKDTVTFIDTDRFGDKFVFDKEYTAADDCYKLLCNNDDNIPYVVGLLNGYKSTAPEIFASLMGKIDRQVYDMPQYRENNIFYTNYGRNSFLYKASFDRVVGAMGPKGKYVNFDTFAKLMKNIDLSKRWQQHNQQQYNQQWYNQQWYNQQYGWNLF